MPGISMIGDSRMAAKSRPTSLPAESRSLARTLRLLQSPKLASEAVLESLDRIPKFPQTDIVRANLVETVDSILDFQDDIPAKMAEHRLSLTMDLAVQNAFANAPLGGSDDETSSIQSLPPSPPSLGPSQTEIKQAKTLRSKSAALVSDSSTVSSTAYQEENNEATTLDSVERAATMRKFWALMLESVHLQVTSQTTTVWGRKKKYEIYRLSGIATFQRGSSLDALRSEVEHEFLSIFSGGDQEDKGACRAYALMRDGIVYVQFNIGKWYDLQDPNNRGPSGEKRKKKDNEFVAILTPGDETIALTASRAPSNSSYLDYVLSALDAVFVKSGDRSLDAKPQQVGDWVGDEPHDLLKAARATQTGRAVGRFAHFASEDVSDPLLEMNKVSTKSILDRTAERQRLERAAKHGRALAMSAAVVERHMEGAVLTAANSNGLLVDTSAALHRNRKRSRDQELGKEGDCPRVQRVCWKWTGETTAASACWLSDGELHEKSDDLPKTKFKCGLVLEGTNVMEGLRQMMAKGYANAPLPDFVRNAPTLGSSSITVSDGAFAATEDSFAAV